GLRFDRAYVQYPVCNPSRSSILTGLYPEQTGVLTNQAAFRTSLPDVSTLPQWFQQHGYHTARVGKIFHYNVPGHIGTDGQDDPASWDEVVNPIGIDKAVEDRIHTLQPGRFGGTLSWLAVDSDSAHTDDEGATAAIRLMESRHPDKTGKPLFLAVGFYRPHTPFVAPTSYFDRYPTDAIEPIMEAEEHRHDKPLAAMADRPRQLELDVETRREIIQAYYASITYMDAQLGRLLDALDTHGLADNTIVVFVSDHGYHLGRHGLWQKGDLYEGSVRVPLVIAMPDAQVANHSADALIEAVDLYPTLAELAGLPAAPHVAGRSFAPLLDDPNRRHRQAALSVAWSRAGWVNKDLGGVPILGHSIRTARFRYTEWAHGRHGVELYDYHTDPDEQTNLAGTPALARHEAALKVQLDTRRRASQPQ
ncbi:MAG: sulfatase, partial [Bacteroidota bacterium]